MSRLFKDVPITLWCSNNARLLIKNIKAKEFLQQMVNRLTVGEFRYGPPTPRQKYFTLLQLEAKAYKSKGNIEQLYNIANYAFLESIAPQNPKFHHDNTAISVTRLPHSKHDE